MSQEQQNKELQKMVLFRVHDPEDQNMCYEKITADKPIIDGLHLFDHHADSDDLLDSIETANYERYVRAHRGYSSEDLLHTDIEAHEAPAQCSKCKAALVPFACLNLETREIYYYPNEE